MDDVGQNVPKQYCSLRSGPSLLNEALRRGEAVATLARVCTVVAQQHRRWWARSLAGFPSENVIAQPQNRGTANGMLLALTCVLERDPLANVVVLPSDHYVRDEPLLCETLRRVVRALRTDEARVVLLGVTPEDVDPQLGYIVPAQRAGDSPVRVRKFVEKPALREAAALIDEGALWNAFIVAAQARSLLGLLCERNAANVKKIQAAWRRDVPTVGASPAVAELYRRLPSLDFSRDIAEGHESLLSVVQVPPCGWSDLGTPERVAHALRGPTRIGVPRAALCTAALSLEQRLKARRAESIARCGTEIGMAG